MEVIEQKITENLYEIDIVEDYFRVNQDCRKSIYYLNSLEIMLNDHVASKECYDIDKINSFQQEVLIIKGQYETLENNYSLKENDKVTDKAIPLDELFYRKLSLEEIPKKLLDYIILTSKCEKLQIDILDYFIYSKDRLCKKLSEVNSKLESFYIELCNSSHLYLAFNKSTDLDKIMTIKFVSNDSNIKSEITKLKLKIYSEDYKVRDYSYKLKQSRALSKMWQNNLIKMIAIVEKVKEEDKLNEISLKQYKYNKQVLFLTYLVVFMTLVSIVIGTVSIYFILLDHGLDILEFIKTK